MLEQDDYIIYMLGMYFGHEMGQEPYINSYLPHFQSVYLPALQKQVGIPLNVVFDSALQVLFVYDKLKDSYCNFEDFNAERLHQQQSEITQLHLMATMYKRSMSALGLKDQLLRLARQLDQQFNHPNNDNYYYDTAMGECMGTFTFEEQPDDESDSDYEERYNQAYPKRLELDGLIAKFNLYSDNS